MPTHFVVYLLSFIVIWFGADLIIKSTDKIAKKLKLSSFAISFFLLGILTSIPEMAVGINSLIIKQPEIFVGTLLGGSIVIFILVIPLLAILGNGIRLSHDLNQKNLLVSLLVIAAPSLVILDHRVTNQEGVFLVMCYLIGFYFIQRKHGILDQKKTKAFTIKAYSYLDLIKVIAGILMVCFSSQHIVGQTILYSQVLDMPVYYISLVILALGANLPELSLAVESVIIKKKDIALGDYLGSASANTLLFGIFTLVNNGEVLTVNNFLITAIFLNTGLAFFFHFSKSKKDISRKEGMILLCIYLSFIVFQLFQSQK